MLFLYIKISRRFKCAKVYNDGINKADEFPTVRSIPIQWIENAVPAVHADLSDIYITFVV